jgi:lycopene beta-cyclase
LGDRRIVLIDQKRERENDRTWCFWETEPGPFEKVVHHRWDRLHFYSSELESELEIAPFLYKMIRGIDFYEEVLPVLEASEQVEWIYGGVNAIRQNEQGVVVEMEDGRQLQGDWCFNSIFKGSIDKTACNYVDQHFKGWFIQSEQPLFTPSSATLMDFRIPQEGEARFFYVLPTDAHTALVELAIFSNQHLTSEGYDQLIRDYIKDYITTAPYEVIHEEMGVIPMTDYSFPGKEGRIVHIGTAGGHTKASTGYTFWRTQQYTQELVRRLNAGGEPFPFSQLFPSRFQLFDSTLLKVILRNSVPTDQIFTDLFRKNPPARILRFLNEQTSLLEDTQLMSSVPMWPFLKAMVGEIGRK